MKKGIYVLLLALAASCGMNSCGTCRVHKVKKAVFVMTEQDTVFDIMATDTYDSISFSANMVDDAKWDITERMLASNGEGERWDEISFRGVCDVKYCFHRKGYEDSDTLYGWQVHLPNSVQILLNNEGKQLKIFGKDYGEKVTLFTPDDKLIAEKNADKNTVDFRIHAGLDYLKVDITRDSGTHFVFNYPVR